MTTIPPTRPPRRPLYRPTGVGCLFWIAGLLLFWLIIGLFARPNWWLGW